MDITQLKMFQTVVECGTMAKASLQLHCVPSNITTRIKQLEEELGAPLFYREGKSLKLTPSGEIFLDYCHKILALCDEAKRSIHPDAPPSGPLKIGAIESSATTRLPNLLAKYHQRYPEVSIQIITGTWKQLLVDISQHKLDGAIVAGNIEFPMLNKLSIYQEDMVLIASHSLGEISCQEDLIGKEIFMWTEGCPYRAALEEWLKLKNISLPITSITSYAPIIGCVSAGSGVALVPKSIYEQYKNLAHIQSYKFEYLAFMQNHFFWHKNVSNHKARDMFIELIKTEFSL
ncbi:LysR family transcriptional regulator [Acinetobacter baumannii]|uniref:LysR family transcriptional regulator n=1 Tax=Acinetobacter baumannii TaxID=470 RepID=A0AAP1QU15_ACIBA|nr:LysR family transcriptional regulator [Acinetobacter baumannii]MBD2851265.1 LysR family transcriptional regulator [Acinetobacter baumannii]MBD3132377.1 LysR family transcriptional regulator [Acinetobacter baumannii]MBE0308315.1 LysR family transcriptional regulator [Acinetobacter baumannii]MBE0311490.1 LysR family transcriptional regulator [Acinetobacter baumannii]MBE0328660.1 LysR family transcriptional regulator [Acinetobacter baumannii]